MSPKISSYPDGGKKSILDFVISARSGKNYKLAGTVITGQHVNKTNAPTINDDSSAGFGVSDLWTDETNDKAYIALDVTVGAAAWTEVTGGGAGGGGVNPNLLINGDFRIAQRGTNFTSATTPANSDDTYLLDRFILLSDGNDIVDVTQETTVVPTGSHNSIKLEVETANKQFGILQIIEGKDAAAIIGGVASLSFDARMAAADDNTHSLKAIVLAWDSTEDVVTSDVVNVWGATPTYVANWTGENTPASNTLTTSWQTFTIENISIDTAGAKNVAVFIFCDQTDGAIDDAIYISKIKLEKGASATDCETRPIAQEEPLAQRFYEKMVNNGTGGSMGASMYQLASVAFFVTTAWATTKRVHPTAAVHGTWTVVNTPQPIIRASPSRNVFLLEGAAIATGTCVILANSSDDAISGDAEL